MMKDLAWYDKMHYVAMLLMAAAMPIDFHCGLWAAGLLVVTSLVKVVAQHRIGNRSLSLPLVMALGAVVLYWLLHLLSISYGGDTAVGFRVVELKAVLLLFALVFLLTDTSFLKEGYVRGLFYALWASACGVFLYHAGVAVGKLMAGGSMASVFGIGFDPRHHAYTALYLDTVLAFIYVELSSRWSVMRRGLRTALLLSVLLLILYVLMVNSRAGVLVMWMVGAIGVIHMAFFRRRWWQALVVALLFSGFVVGMGKVLPGHSDRLATTVENVSSVVSAADGEAPETDDEDNITPDARIEINKSALGLALERPLTGYGASRYRACLVERYEKDGFDHGTTAGYNAHNQYVETVLATGMVGLILLMAFLLVPLWRAWVGRHYLLPALLFTAIVCANLLFESMLERQMGLLFIGYFMILIILLINLEENKFGRSPKN